MGSYGRRADMSPTRVGPSPSRRGGRRHPGQQRNRVVVLAHDRAERLGFSAQISFYSAQRAWKTVRLLGAVHDGAVW
jgi:hypothetical protein